MSSNTVFSPTTTHSQSPSDGSPISLQGGNSQTGRPSTWTASRQRKLARLYLYTKLSPKDIREVLKDKEDGWVPGKESTAKTVNSLLNDQPRWLRPRTREDAALKVSGLSECGKQRKLRRNFLSREEPGLTELIQASQPIPNDRLELSPSNSTFEASALDRLIQNPLLNVSTSIPSSEHKAIGDNESWSATHFLKPASVWNLNLEYGFHDIARGAQGITTNGRYLCPICNNANIHTSSALDQMKCAVAHDRPRNTPDLFGMTPAHALISYRRFINGSEEIAETPEQTAELFRVLFPVNDKTFREAIYTLGPSGHSLLCLLAARNFKTIIWYIARLMNPSLGYSSMATIIGEGASTYVSISSVRARLPQESASVLKHIARLTNAHSVTNSSAADTTKSVYCASVDAISAPSQFEVEADSATVHLDLLPGPSHLVKLTLPDSLLRLDRHLQHQGLCMSGLKPHDSGTCWCHVVESLAFQLWVCKTGLVNKLVEDPPRSLLHLDLHFRDAFGNMLLHMLAARGASIEIILDALAQGVDGNARNTGDQGFLHIVSRHKILTWAETPEKLALILQKLNSFNVKLLECDLFGRNFFHRLTRHTRSFDYDIQSVFKYLNIKLPAGRDAFGWIAIMPPDEHGMWNADSSANDLFPEMSPDSSTFPSSGFGSYLEHEGSNTLSAGYNVRSFSRPPCFLSTAEIFTFKHARLLESARRAEYSPWFEDSEGRNGLQCLAEASLTLDIHPLNSTNSKRKRESNQSTAVTTSNRLELRFDLVQGLIDMGVDVNNYDNHGNTVLMSFTTHIQDGEDDKTLAKLLRYLILKGANIHRRNRHGETAFHIAVKLGRKVATRVLLEEGANVHARTAEGKGVLALGEVHYFKAQEDPPLYASIMACMSIAMDYGAVAAPTLVQEWKFKSGDKSL